MTKTCRECRQPFKCLQDRQRFCSVKCARVSQGKRKRGIRPEPAIRAAAASRSANTRQALRQQFGELSVREIELFRWAWKSAYQRGYNKAYKADRRAA